MLRTISRAATFQNHLFRCFQTSSFNRLREIVVESKDQDTTVIEAKYVDSPRIPFLLKIEDNSNRCPLCKLKLNLKHTDVLILSQFINSKGEIMKQFQTGLCKRQHKLVKELIYMAQYAGLLPEPPREEPKKPYQTLNTYYDEKTINLYPTYKKHEPRFYHLKTGPIESRRIKPELGYSYKKLK